MAKQASRASSAQAYAEGEIPPTALGMAALGAKEAYDAAKRRTLAISDSLQPRNLIVDGEALIAEGAAQAAYIVSDNHFGLGSALAVVYCTAEAACGLKPPNAESATQATLLRDMVAYPFDSR